MYIPVIEKKPPKGTKKVLKKEGMRIFRFQIWDFGFRIVEGMERKEIGGFGDEEMRK